MDKAKDCDQMDNNLQDLAAYLETLTFPTPSTLEASRQQAASKRLAEELKTRIAEAIAKVNELRTSAAPSWDMARQEIDRRWQEISELKRRFA